MRQNKNAQHWNLKKWVNISAPNFARCFRHFGVRRVNAACNNRLVDSYVLNKWAKFGAKIFTHFWEIAVYVLGRFILTHPVRRAFVVNLHSFSNFQSIKYGSKTDNGMFDLPHDRPVETKRIGLTKRTKIEKKTLSSPESVKAVRWVRKGLWWKGFVEKSQSNGR